MESPFEQVLLDLNQVGENVGKLITPVSTLDNAVIDITNVLNDIDEVFVVFSDVCVVIEDLQAVCAALEVVPGVDVVASALEAAGSVIDSVNEAIAPLKVTVEDIDSIMKEVEQGITSLKNVLVEIANDVPDATKTLAILNALLDIAGTLAKVLSGSEASERLSNVVDEYNKVKTEVSTDIEPVAKAFDEITGVIDDFASDISKAVGEVSQHISNAKNSISTASSHITPVHDAMKIINDILWPVKWLFKAAEWLVHHLLDPLIKKAEELSGLSKLTDDLEKKLVDALGIGDLITAIHGGLSGNNFQQHGALFNAKSDTSATAQAITGWAHVAELLLNYKNDSQQQKNELIETSVEALVNALVTGTIDIDSITIAPPPTPGGSSSSAESSQSVANSVSSSSEASSASSVPANYTTTANESMANKIQKSAQTLSQLTSAKGSAA